MTEAENDLPERNGRCAVGAVELWPSTDGGGLDDGDIGGVHVWVAVGRAARRARRSAVPLRAKFPAPRWTCATRSRFSLSVPVLSKQTTSMRPSASTERGTRTSAPNFVSRRADAACARVATNGIPSGTAATAMAMPLATACAQDRAPQQPQRADQRAAGHADGEGPVGELAELVLQTDVG